MSDIGKMMSNGESTDFYANIPALVKAEHLADDIVECFFEYGVEISIKKRKIELWGDGFRFTVKLKGKTTLSRIKEYTDSVKYRLKLPVLNLILDNGSIYFTTARNSQKNINNSLLQIMQYPEYAAAFESHIIAHPIGVDSKGTPVIADLTKYPHAMICGTTTSGKTVSLKCMITSLLRYQPYEVNLLLADRLLQLSTFADVPHLSCPIIDGEDTFASAILILKDEMDRRLELKKADIKSFDACPHIVCIVDEFPSFLRGLDNGRRNVVVKAINEMLEEARHLKIHLMLVLRDPTSDNIGISVSDLRTKLVFQVTNPQKSWRAIGLGKIGAEKLKGKGDMYFYQGGEPIHLQGVNITDAEIANVVQRVTSSFMSAKRHALPNADIRTFPRGRYGFTITDENVQQKNAEFIAIQNVVPIVSSGQISGNSKDDERLANTILWTLAQNAISISDVQKTCHMSYQNASETMEHMHNMGIVSSERQGPQKRDVLPKSIADLSDEVRSLLERYIYSEETIVIAFEKRTGASKLNSGDVQDESNAAFSEATAEEISCDDTDEDIQNVSRVAFSGKITLTDELEDI